MDNPENLFSIRIYKPLWPSFKRLQRERGVNRNALTNEAIAFYLKHQPELQNLDTEKAPA